MFTQILSILARAPWKKINLNVLLTIIVLASMYLVGRSSYNYALQFTSYPPTKAISKYSRPPYLTKKEQEEYRMYLMSQKNETKFMRWGEWKLSKVFTKTLSELEIPIEDK